MNAPPTSFSFMAPGPTDPAGAQSSSSSRPMATPSPHRISRSPRSPTTSPAYAKCWPGRTAPATGATTRAAKIQDAEIRAGKLD
jgi:hypothetical protein